MATNPGAKNKDGSFKDPKAAINAGLMKKKSGEVIGPGKAIAKVAGKVAEKVIAKTTTKDVVKNADKFAKKFAAAKTPAQKSKAVVSKAKADAKVEKSALKAANKPTSKNNASVGPKTSAYVSDTLKNMKPANPKVTRGGSMKSKLNWPESMTKPKGK